MIQDYKINAFQKTHAMLPDNPSDTMTEAQLKAWWDSAPEEVRVALNGLIDALGTDYATKAELSGIQLGQITDGTITEPKLETTLAQKVNGGLADFLSRQAIINGNFDIWQRGASWTNPTPPLYTADRWNANYGNAGVLPNITHSRQQITPGELAGASYFYRMNFDGAGSGSGNGDFYRLYQRIENGIKYLCGAGKKVTVSFYARSNIAGKRIAICLKENYGSGGAPSAVETLIGQIIALTPNWNRYSFTFSTNTLTGKTFGSNNDDYLQLDFYTMWGTSLASSTFGVSTSETFGGAGNVDLAQIQVNAGDIALPAAPRSFAEELSLCQRYYEKSYDYGVAPGTVTSNGAENVVAISTDNLAKQDTRFRVRKRVVPTVTVYSAQNGAAGSVSEFTGGGVFSSDRAVNTSLISESSYVIGKPAAFNANNFERWHWTADAEL